MPEGRIQPRAQITSLTTELTDAQLPKLLTRPRSAPAADQEVVRRFVALEPKRRAAAAPFKPGRAMATKTPGQPIFGSANLLLWKDLGG